VGKKADGSSLHDGEECRCKLARVHRLLGEEIAMAVTKRVAGQEFVEVGAFEGVAKTPGFRDVTLDGGVGLEGDLETGETVETVEECRVE
jgi:hypothetical protein